MKNDKIKLFIEESLKMAPRFRKNIIQPSNFFQDVKLSPHQHLCLSILLVNKDISMTDLALKLGVSNQQLTRIMDYLVENKWVIRYTSEENRRIVLSSITEEGKIFLLNIKEKMIEHISIAFSDLSENDLDECIGHLRAVNKILSKTK